MKLKWVLPKGHLFKETMKTLDRVGYKISGADRSYRPKINDSDIEIKIFRAQNIAKLVEIGSHDLGITGLDWIKESNADVVELLNLKFRPSKVVAAVPEKLSISKPQDLKKKFKNKKIIVASEYENLTKKYMKKIGIDNYVFLLSYGATESFPPEDANLIIEVIETGETLKQNDLRNIDVIMETAPRLIANKDSLKNPWKKEKINAIKILIEGAVRGKVKIILEMNVSKANLDKIMNILPALKSPTISELYNGSGYAVKSVVDKNDVPKLIPKLRKAGATGIIETNLRKVI